MTTQQMQFFIEVASCLSFTQAADRLFVSQPTISRQIAMLEDELGFPLFYRERKRILLTPGGESLYRELSRIVMMIDESISKAARVMQGLEGKLSIGCLTGMNTDMFVYPPTVRFVNEHPNIELIFKQATFSELRNMLSNNVCDVVFTFDFELPAYGETSHELCYAVNSVLLMSRSHPLANEPNCTVQDFQDETFLLPHQEDSHGRYSELLDILKRMGLSRDKINVRYYPNMESTLFAVRAGLGIAVSDTSMSAMYDKRFNYFKLPRGHAELNMVMVWKNDNPNPILPLYREIWSQHKGN